MAVLRFGQQHAGQKSPQSHRQAGGLETERDTQHQEQRESGEHLALARACDVAKYRAREEMPADECDGNHRQRKAQAAPGKTRGATGIAQQWQKRQHRNHRQVLKQQNREAGLAARGPQPAPLVERLQRQRRGRQGQRHAGHQTHARVDPQGPGHQADQHNRPGYLRKPQADKAPAHAPQALGLKFQADDEQQEHHADLGEAPHIVDIGYQLEAPGADGDAGDQIAGHRAKPQAMRDHHRDDRRGEVDAGLDQKRVAVFHVFPRTKSRMPRQGPLRERARGRADRSAASMSRSSMGIVYIGWACSPWQSASVRQCQPDAEGNKDQSDQTIEPACGYRTCTPVPPGCRR